MRSLRLALLLFLALAAMLPAARAAAAPSPSPTVYFSPGVREHLLPLLAQTRKTLDVAMYSFTDSDLAWALVKAAQRGVKVRVYLDEGQASGRYAKGRFLEKRGIAVRYYHGQGLMHHKFAVLDGQTVITGSYNWTASAEEHNKENALVLSGRALAAAYSAEFEKLWRR